MSNFFFCHLVFKKPSAVEASESVYMRERVNDRFNRSYNLTQRKTNQYLTQSPEPVVKCDNDNPVGSEGGAVKHRTHSVLIGSPVDKY